MNSEINLLPLAQVKITRTSRTLKLLRFIAIGSVAAVLLMSVIIFFLTQQLSPERIKEKEEKILFNMSFLQKKQAKLIVINERIKSISGIIESRPNFDSTMIIILQKIPDGISINSLSVDKNRITLTASSNSLSSIDNLLNNFIEMASQKKIIKNITIDSLTADVKGGGYSLSMRADMI